PEADGAIADRLESNPGSAIPLAAKFGTRSLLQAMRQAYESEEWPCDEESWFLAYFLRFDGSDGLKRLNRAMAARENRGCFKGLLGDVARVVWNPLMQRRSIAALHDPNNEVAADAATTLAAHGGPEVEAHLWRRLEQWSEQWRGRARELQAHPITSADPNQSE